MFDPQKVTYFAETDSRNQRVPFGIKAEDRLKHFYVIGKTGMGKSTLLENMAVQDISGGEGMCFIDPHGKTAELLLEYIPEERIKDVVYFAPFDTEFPISFNVMEDVGIDKRHLVANGLMSAFKKIWVDAWSARMEYILTNTLLALLEYPGSSLLGVNRMLSDKEFRNKVVDNIQDPSVRSFWVDEFAKYGPQYMQEAGAAIQNKIGQFTANPLVRNIIGQDKSAFDIRKIMDEGKIMIVNLSKGRVGEANANLLGAMLITKIYLAAMSRADRSPAELQKLPNFYLYVDEFQSFANESFADILSEARKYKLNLTIAHQYIEQMSEEVRAAVFGNVGTMVAFRVGSYDAEVLEKEFAPVFTAEDMVNLGFAQIYLKLMIDGIGSQPFSARTLPPIKKPDQEYKQQVIDSSRKQFALPKAEVEKVIRDWHEEGRVADDAPAPRDRRSRDARSGDRRAPSYNERREPKAMDFRGMREERKEEKKVKAELVESLPSDDFKPLTAFVPPTPPKASQDRQARQPQQASLKQVAQKPKDNQRKPSEKNLSDLRSVLAGLVTQDAPKITNAPKPVESKPAPQPAPVAKPEPPTQPRPEPQAKTVRKEPSAEELKKLLGVE